MLFFVLFVYLRMINRYSQTKKKPHKHHKANKGSSDPVNVFCRIRPLPGDADKCVEKIDDRTIQLSAPSSALRNGNAKDMRYTFQYVFDEDSKQTALFDDVGQPLVKDLIKGKNGMYKMIFFLLFESLF